MKDVLSALATALPILLGVLVGFGLNCIYRRFGGRLTCHVIHFKVQGFAHGPRGSPTVVPLAEADRHVEVSAIIILHNSKEIPIALMTPELVFLDRDKKESCKGRPWEIQEGSQRGVDLINIAPCHSQRHFWSVTIRELEAVRRSSCVFLIAETEGWGKFRVLLGPIQEPERRGVGCCRGRWWRWLLSLWAKIRTLKWP